MNASSQTPPEAPRLEPVPAPWPPNGGHQNLCAYVGGIGPHRTCTNEPPAPSAAAAAPVSPDVPAHLVVDAPEPSVPTCNFCGMTGPAPLYPDPHGRRYPSGAQLLFCGTCVPDATPTEAVTAVVSAEMGKDAPVTPRDIARAEVLAGVVFDPASIEAVRTAERAQARAEDQAEINALRQDNASLLHFKKQLDGIRTALAGRPEGHMMRVQELLDAADGTDRRAGTPLSLKWDTTDGVDFPDGSSPGGRAVVKCTTPYGGRAHLVLTGEDRHRLASLVGPEVRDIHAPCPTPGCGTDHDWDATDLFGWSRLQIASLGEGPRWYCSDMCVFDALARAGHDLAAEDRAAAIDPNQQAPELLYGGDPLAYGPTGIPCGCGKPAHSNLVSCQPDEPADVAFEHENGGTEGGAL